MIELLEQYWAAIPLTVIGWFIKTTYYKLNKIDKEYLSREQVEKMITEKNQGLNDFFLQLMEKVNTIEHTVSKMNILVARLDERAKVRDKEGQ